MIVVCGEALFDVFAAGERAASVDLSACQGGSPFNLATGLARLGGKASFFGGLSRDMFGRRLHAALAAEGVDLAAAPRPDAPTALVMVGVDDRGVPVYTFYGSGTAERAVSIADLARVPADAQAIHVGSYCMVVEPVASSLRALVERQRGRSLIVYDPNVRLTIAPDIEAWRDSVRWMQRRADVLKVSEEDIHALYPDMRVDTFIAESLEAGVALVVVTWGERGVVAVTRSQLAVEVPAVPVTVVDTVGAGDTFQAGLLAWLQRAGKLTRRAVEGLVQDELVEALRFAARAAAITCSRRGADLPYTSELADAEALDMPQP
ncbi:carbohydrate kinase [Massilia sp. TW-1]|uniref:Carbohydrate kinase n=1 Tax=Telluria antibiotica TaxID=2717319 RepID=A0ABX0P8J2_9BURK|nr:carbohydrate kinase [Telluria antibiotica]NIA52994.1 carbohydrate kinase [Telluria antibiotica]